MDLKLPCLLESNLDSGRASLNADEIASLQNMLAKVESPSPVLYDRERICSANRLWSSQNAQYYLGIASQAVSPGDIDPKRALIIGHAEPDSPIALDYRSDPPRVVYLGDMDNNTYWFELAPTYEALIAKVRS